MPEKVTIEKVIHRGLGLARLASGKAVFVPLTLPGEEIQVRITQEHSSYCQGEMVDLLTPSPHRRAAPCPYFGQCGGCQLMHMNYSTQLQIKQSILSETWRNRIPVEFGSRHSQEFDYRHRVRFQVTADGTRVGFYSLDNQRIVPVTDCLVCTPAIRSVIPWLETDLLPVLHRHRFPVQGISVASGTASPALIRVETDQPVPDDLVKVVDAMSPFPLEWSSGRFAPRYTRLDVGSLPVQIGVGSFFQAHPAAVDDVLHHEALALPAGKRLLELYAGMGLFTIFFAAGRREIVAIEGDPGAARLFRANRHLIPGHSKVEYRQVAVEEWLRRHHAELNRFAAVFVDPPRTGLSRPVRRILGNMTPACLLYLSCEISTQHRDVISWLDAGKYHLDRLILFDFFPNTFHMESLVRLHGSCTSPPESR